MRYILCEHPHCTNLVNSLVADRCDKCSKA
jgi:hypothetical protein